MGLSPYNKSLKASVLYYFYTKNRPVFYFGTGLFFVWRRLFKKDLARKPPDKLMVPQRLLPMNNWDIIRNLGKVEDAQRASY